LLNINLVLITTMAGTIKNLIILNLLYWISMINWPTFKTHLHKTPIQEGTDPTKVPPSYHRSRIKSPDAPIEGQTHMLDLNRSTPQTTVTPATSFARTPAFRRKYNPLEVGKKFDLYVYDEGRAPVLEGENYFDLDSKTLGKFLRMLDKKATDQGWNNASSAQKIVFFSITHNGNPTTRISITKEHHYIEMDALRSQCKRFMIEGDSQH